MDMQKATALVEENVSDDLNYPHLRQDDILDIKKKSA